MLVRSETLGCFEACYIKNWGAFCKKIKDPLADVKDLDVTSFDVVDTFAKIPSSLWERIVSLYFEYVTLLDSEVTVILFQHKSRDKWKCCVPLQVVSSASAKANFKHIVDIETGQEFTYPDEWDDDWIHVGSSHSHGSMRLDTFSSTDDNSELSIPGIHILVSCIDVRKSTYKVTASIVQNYTRYYVDETLVIQLDGGVKEQNTYKGYFNSFIFKGDPDRLIYTLSNKTPFTETIKEYVHKFTKKTKNNKSRKGTVNARSKVSNHNFPPKYLSRGEYLNVEEYQYIPVEEAKLSLRKAFQKALDSGVSLKEIEDILYGEDPLYYDDLMNL